MLFIKKNIFVYGILLGMSAFFYIEGLDIRHICFDEKGLIESFCQVLHKDNMSFERSLLSQTYNLANVLHMQKRIMQVHAEKIVSQKTDKNLFTKYDNQNLVSPPCIYIQNQIDATQKQKEFVSALYDALSDKTHIARMRTAFSAQDSQKHIVPSIVEKIYHYQIISNGINCSPCILQNNDKRFAQKTLAIVQKEIEADIKVIMPLLKKQ